MFFFIIITSIFYLEQTQFDNPVYAYQGSSKFDDGTTTLLNNFQFRNNLGTNKKINNEKVRLGMNSCTDDEDDCKGIIINNKLIKLYFWKIFMFYLIILD